jgi:hypothetical protein
MELKEINEIEFKNLLKNKNNYFANGCCFDDVDNLIAFPHYPNSISEPDKYYHIINKES